jgi:hypothetical protein
MTANKFHSLALAIPGAVEASHMDHPDFRIGGKIFASLGYPDDDHGMVNLTPEDQERLMKQAPEVFEPCVGVWGKRGATSVRLRLASVTLVRGALEAAAGKVAMPKGRARTGGKMQRREAGL